MINSNELIQLNEKDIKKILQIFKTKLKSLNKIFPCTKYKVKKQQNFINKLHQNRNKKVNKTLQDILKFILLS